MIATIKSILTVESVIRSCGIDVVRGKCHCPFHADGTPSLSVYANNTKWNCFGCGAHGDIFDFIELHDKTDTPGAIKLLADMAGVTPNISRREVEELKKKRAQRDYAHRLYGEWEQKRINDLSALLRLYHHTIFTPDNIDILTPLIHSIPEIEHEYEVFCQKDTARKLELYRRFVDNESRRVRGRDTGGARTGGL